MCRDGTGEACVMRLGDTRSRSTRVRTPGSGWFMTARATKLPAGVRRRRRRHSGELTAWRGRVKVSGACRSCAELWPTFGPGRVYARPLSRRAGSPRLLDEEVKRHFHDSDSRHQPCEMTASRRPSTHAFFAAERSRRGALPQGDRNRAAHGLQNVSLAGRRSISPVRLATEAAPRAHLLTVVFDPASTRSSV